jgi:hypothetical protein
LFCAPELVLGSTVGVPSRFCVLRSRTCFRRYRGRRVPFSYIVLPNSFSAVTWASGSVFTFHTPELVFGGTEGVGSRFHVLRSRTRFGRLRGRRVPFSRFARPNSFSAVPWASGRVFTFCAPELVFVGIESVSSRFHVLRSRTHFRRYRGRRVPFSCLARPDSFSALRGACVLFSCLARPDSFWRYRGRRVQF